MHIVTPNSLDKLVGVKIKSAPIHICKDMIDAYIALVGDSNPIHNADHEALCPGNLLVALLPRMMQTQVQWRGFAKLVSAKYAPIKFLKPVKAGADIRLCATYIDLRPHTYHNAHQIYAHSKLLLRDGENSDVLRADHVEMWFPH